MATTFNAIYLGNISTAIDPTEGNNVAENARSSNVLGTYGNGGNRGGVATPLWDNVYSAKSQNNFGDTGALDADNSGSRFDFFQVDRTGDGTRENYNFDGLVSYNATLTYFDNTTADTTVLVAQMTNGDLYLLPPSSASSANPALTAKAIQSLKLNTEASGDRSLYNMSRDRQVQEFACFAAGTMIRTAEGAVAVETLKAGDMVMTTDAGSQPVLWVGQAEIDIAAAPHLRPVRIRAGALGRGMPSADLVVSPQHRVMVRSKIAQRMFGADEVLVAAKQLLGLDGVELAADMDRVTYVHFMFDQHQIVCSNGASTESLFTGPEALKSVGPAAREEILGMFPKLRDADLVPSDPARPLIPGRKARQLAERHAANRRELVS